MGDTSVSFQPENALEQSLVKAAADPAFIPQFYREFARADIFIIQQAKEAPRTPAEVTLQQSETIQIQNIEYKGTLHVPFFSSLTRLQAALKGEAAYLRINALEFLKMTIGSPLLLNPGSDYGKEIAADEAASIIDGSIWRPSERHVVKEATKVLIGQPKNYPTDLVTALTRLFKTKKQVKRAWIAHFFDPARDERPHTLVAIEADNFDEIAAEAGVVARNVSMPDPPLDLVPITGRGEIEDYFLKQAQPFYQRRLLGLFG